MNIETLIQLQVEAYNERNLEKFCQFYDPNIKIYELLTNKLLVQGHSGLRDRYRERFTQSPQIHCTILSRITHGTVVIDQEYITGYNGNQTIIAVIIYEILAEKITRVWTLR